MMTAMSFPRVRATASALARRGRSAWRSGRDGLARFGAAAGMAIGQRAGAAAARAARGWETRPGARRRRLRRLASRPLPNLSEVYPEARQATPREIGLRSIDLDDIAGTAVGGPTQRGADFKPLPPFRSRNWAARWQRIRRAVDRLEILPPIDVVRYPPGGRSWVLDGHNRVAAALEVGQVEIDANVTELVPLGENPSERPGDLAATLIGTRSLRAAGRGGRLRTVGDDAEPGLPRRIDAQAPAPGSAFANEPQVEEPPAAEPETVAEPTEPANGS
jgi:hypothetical protein